MNKADAIALFGRRQTDLARALGISKQAVHQWASVLTQSQADRVRGAAVRLGIALPEHEDPPDKVA